MATITIELLIGVVLLLGLLILYRMRKFNFWKSRNVDGPKPSLIFGNTKDVVLNKYSLPVHLKNLYEKYQNAPMIGIYVWSEPVLVLHDINLIENVLVRDFDSFSDRESKSFAKHEPLSAHMMFLEAERSEPLREMVTSAFTTNKLYRMFHLVMNCANLMDAYLTQVDGKAINVRDICAKYVLDVIGSCAFGISSNTLAKPKCQFREAAKRVFHINWKNYIKTRLQLNAPDLYNVIGGFFVDHNLTKYFINLTRNTIENRKKDDYVERNDFIDLLTDIRDRPGHSSIELTDTLLTAQLFGFFITSFATSSATMSNCLFELAMNRRIRDNVRVEIKKKLSPTNGKITFQGIENMKYLDKVIDETLRKYPAGPMIKRVATKPYTFAKNKVSIPVGTKILVPTFAIQRDAKYYPDPDKFDPERFNDTEWEKRPYSSYLAFGSGPRDCIGKKFAKMQIKTGLVKILQHHIVEVCDQTDQNYEMHPRANVLAPKHGIILKIKKIR